MLDNIELILAKGVKPNPQTISAWEIKLRKRMEETRANFLTDSKRETLFNKQSKKVIGQTRKTTSLYKGNYYFSLGYNGNHLHYKELEGQETLDENYGKLHGFYLNAGLRAKGTALEEKIGDIFLEAYFMRYGGSTTYDGQTLFGGFPLVFEQKQKIYQFGLRAGEYQGFPSGIGEGFAFFDVGHRIWYRGESGLTPAIIWINGQGYDILIEEYREKYWWTYFGLGAGFNLFVYPRWTIGAEGEFMFSPRSLSKMHADATSIFNEMTFTLGGVLGCEVQIPLRIYLTKNVLLEIIPYFNYWHIKRSNEVMDCSSGNCQWFVEPKSNTHIEGIRSGISLGF